MSFETIIDELAEYCRATGLKESTVCVRAIGDSRYVSRYKRKIAVLNSEAERIRDYISAHPPKSEQEDAA